MASFVSISNHGNQRDRLARALSCTPRKENSDQRQNEAIVVSSDFIRIFRSVGISRVAYMLLPYCLKICTTFFFNSRPTDSQ